MHNRGRLPSYAFLSPEATQRLADVTGQGAYGLSPFEKMWMRRRTQLSDHGYVLRPRYAQDWRPSWIGTNNDPFYCEDSIMSMVSRACAAL